MSKRSTPAAAAQQSGRTLLDYCAKKSKQQSSDKGDDGASASSANSSAPPRPGQQAQSCSGQQNFMTVQNPSGGTTIFVNADTYVGTTEPCTSLRAHLPSSDLRNQQPPCDIASGPHEKHVQQQQCQHLNFFVRMRNGTSYFAMQRR